MWGNTFNSFAQGIGDATATAIIEGQSFGEAMQNIGRAAISQVISGLVQIGVKRLALAAIERSIATTGAAANVVTAAATGTAMAAAYAPAATFASLASFGANAIPASAGISATFALTEGLALAGMAHDGIDNVPREGTWLLDRGERVVDSRTNADLKNYLNSNRQSGGGISIHIANQFHSSVNEADMAEFIERQSEVVYSAVAKAKNDRGESF